MASNNSSRCFKWEVGVLENEGKEKLSWDSKALQTSCLITQTLLSLLCGRKLEGDTRERLHAYPTFALPYFNWHGSALCFYF